MSEGKRRVIRVLEPVKPPVAPGLEGVGERGALAAVRDTAVGGAGEAAELGLAAVEKADAAAGDVEVEVVASEVAAGGGGLDDHFLAGDGAVGEGESGRC